MCFTKVDDEWHVISEPEHWVLLQGEISVGKSTFISKVLDSLGAEGERPKASRQARGTTKEVALWPPLSSPPARFNGVLLRFVDVPGLGDVDTNDNDTFDSIDAALSGKPISCVLFMTESFVCKKGTQLAAKWLRLAFPKDRQDYFALVKTKADVWEAEEDDPCLDELCKELGKMMLEDDQTFKFRCHIGRSDPFQPVLDIVQQIVDLAGPQGQYKNPSNMFLRLSPDDQCAVLHLESQYFLKRESTKLFQYLSQLEGEVGVIETSLSSTASKASVANAVVGTSKWTTTAANITGAVFLFTPLAPIGGVVLLGSGGVSLATSAGEWAADRANHSQATRARTEAADFITRLNEKIESFAEIETAVGNMRNALEAHEDGVRARLRQEENVSMLEVVGAPSTNALSSGTGIGGGVLGVACEMAPTAVSVPRNMAAVSTVSGSSATTFQTAASGASTASTASTATQATSGLTPNALASLGKGPTPLQMAVNEGSVVAPKALSGAAVAGRVLGCVGAAISVADLAWWHSRDSAIHTDVATQQRTLRQCRRHISDAKDALRTSVLVGPDGRISADLGITKWFVVAYIPEGTCTTVNVTVGTNQTFTNSDLLELAASLAPDQGARLPVQATLKAKLEKKRSAELKHNVEVVKKQEMPARPYATHVWQLAIIGYREKGPILYKTSRLSRTKEGEVPEAVPACDVAEWFELHGAPSVLEADGLVG
eukprot:TRINITY_DN76033_c0_g1_i1.p1 TRINITY_DN76033_c0_g1~~TRINITY_DN76033_c0_g1_i1.p1  ORF type:complete len:743 (-),score=120.65 TRINITY_DN76033_c0_g1_i1:156-2303(-)